MKLINDGYTTLSGLNIAPTTRDSPQEITCVSGQTIFPIYVPFVRSINTVMLQAGGEGMPDTLTSPDDYSLSYDYENHNYIITLTSSASAGDVLIIFYTYDANKWIDLQNVTGEPDNVLSLSGLTMELKVIALLDAPLESGVTMRIFVGNPSCMEFCLYSKELNKNFRHDSDYASGYPQYLMTIEPVVVFPIGTSITHMTVTFSSDSSSDTSISGLIYIYDMSKSLDIATINNQEPLSDESIADAILGGTKQPINTDASGHVLIAGAKNALDDLKDFDHANDEVISNVTKILGSSLVESDDGQVALGLSEFFDVETPAKDINDIGAVTLTDEQATALATSIAGGLVDQDGEAGDGKIRLDANGNVYTVNNNNEMYKG